MAASEPTPASPLRVVFVGVCLLGILGLSLSLARPKDTSLDPKAAMEKLYGGVPSTWGSLGEPAGMKLPTGESLITFSGGADPEVEELTLMLVPGRRATDVLKDQFQGLRFDSGDSKWGSGGGRGGRRGGSGGGGGRGGGRGDKDEKPKLQDLSTFDWNGYDATYARLRHGGGSPDDDKPFYEVVRVNLSSEGRCVIAYVRFRERTLGDATRVQELLGAL